ncbi:Leucine-rich repeat-containing protein 40, partial [Fasciolopsis buskii]
ANKLHTLPAGLTRLRGLTQLDVSNNQLERIDGDLSNLVNLDQMDLSENRLTSFPDHLPPTVRQLNLSHNHLEQLPSGILDQVPSLQSLDISSNLLSSLSLFGASQSGDNRHQLVTLRATFNRFTELPSLNGLKLLKEVYLSDNRITTVDLQKLNGCPIATLDLARNKIAKLPDGIPVAFPELVRLDVSANEISVLPTELGLMDRLQVLLVDCNPLRSIRHNVLSGGTEAIKTLLRQRHRPDSTPETASASSTTAPNAEPQHQDLTLKEQAPRSPPAVPKGTHVIKAECISAPTVRAGPVISQTSCDSPLPCVNASYILDWSSGPHSAQTKKFPELPDPDSTEAWLAAAAGPHMSAVNVRTLHLAYRKLTSLPTGLFAFAPTLTSLVLENNKLTDLPDQLDSLSRLSTLDLTRNQFRSIPAPVGRLPALTTLRLDQNPLGPDCSLSVLTDGSVHTTLEHLSLRSCQLTHTPEPSQLKPDCMPNLSYLDLSDNSIATIPAELGLCTQLKSVQLGGNTFRVPRPAILTKGTPAVLEYLRSRLPL